MIQAYLYLMANRLYHFREFEVVKMCDSYAQTRVADIIGRPCLECVDLLMTHFNECIETVMWLANQA